MLRSEKEFLMINEQTNTSPAPEGVSRRSFLKQVGATTLSAAVLQNDAVAGDPPPTALHDPALVHEDVTFTSGDQQVDAYLCHPKNQRLRGSVIVIHEIFGLTDHIKDVACRLAQAGFTALAPNYFTREGNPPSDFAALRPFVRKIPDSQIIADTTAATQFLQERSDSNKKVGVVGFCWGGYYAMLSSAEVEHLDAAVAYYGRIRLAEKTANQPHAPIELVAQMHAPLLGNFGALDSSIPPADADALREELKQHGKQAEIYVYEGAGHAFNNDTRENYNPAAAHLAWTRTLAWFNKHLKR